MELSSINPHIRVAMHSVIRSGESIKQRVIYDYELIYLERGEFTLHYESTSHLCRSGDILLLCPGVPHCFTLDHGDISQPHIHFDLTARPESNRIPVSFKDLSEMTEKEKEWIQSASPKMN